MKCRKYQEQITASLDNALEEEEARELDSHLAECPQCRGEYQIEKVARNLVRSRLKPMRAPAEVLQRVSSRIAEESVTGVAATPREPRSWFSSFLSSIYFRPAVAFTLACFAIILIINNNSSTRSNVVQASILPDNDVIRQSLVNFEAVTAGKIQPQILSNNSDQVRGYFEGKTEFPVVIPPLVHCRLIGGVLNDYSGFNLAHMMFSHNDTNIIYIYETCWKKVQAGSPLQLSDEVRQELRDTGWYMANDANGNSIVLWTTGQTLCAAVSRLDQETLIACLTAEK